MKPAKRLENNVHQLEIDHLIVGHGRRRLRIGDGARRICEPHHVAHTIVEVQVRPETTDERIEHAGLDHRWPQVHRAASLRIAIREIEARNSILDGDGHGKLHRMVDHHAVAVEQTLGRGSSLGQSCDRRAQLVGRCLEDGRKRVHHRARAETVAQLFDALRAHLRYCDLRLDIAAHQRRLSAVGEDDALHVGLPDARLNDLDRRHEEAFLEHLGCVRRGRARDCAAHVRLVRDRAGKCDDLARRKHWREEGHVGNMREAALVGVIGNEDVAGLYCSLAAIELEDTAHEVAIDRRMEKHRRRHDQAPLAVQNHAAEIPGFADDR